MSDIHEMPPAMILCGGKGTRLRDVTEMLPKPMVPIGEQPILWHIMRGYAASGVRRFILCLGYKRDCFVDYFLNFHAYAADITVRLGQHGAIAYHDRAVESDWEVTLADTGIDTMTGGRVARASRYLRDDDDAFFLTYGDGVSDIDIGALLATHRASGKLITVSAVHPEGRFGEMRLEGGLVTGFEEKPARLDGCISGGFMVLRKSSSGATSRPTRTSSSSRHRCARPWPTARWRPTPTGASGSAWTRRANTRCSTTCGKAALRRRRPGGRRKVRYKPPENCESGRLSN